MKSPQIPYRKLPGHRRGFIGGSSVWLGPDHLLLVRSHRFREEYRRFYFHDIQAITIADGNRFHISTRSALLIAIWLVLLLVGLRTDGMTPWVLFAAVLAIGAWVYVSLERSCYCRIFTAVSSDTLPSIYRTWSARKFLGIVHPHIHAAQGDLPEGWMALVEQRPVGPVMQRRIAPPLPSAVDENAPEEPLEEPAPLIAPAPGTGKALTVGGAIFAAMLLLEFGIDLLLYFQAARWATWAFAAVLAVQTIGAVIIFLERATGRLSTNLHRAAIAKLVWASLGYYATVTTTAGFAMRDLSMLAPSNPIVLGIDAAISIVILVFSIAMMMESSDEQPTSILGV